jgi:hypothetical protein
MQICPGSDIGHHLASLCFAPQSLGEQLPHLTIGEHNFPSNFFDFSATLIFEGELSLAFCPVGVW